MRFQDDRTPAIKAIPHVIVLATDSFMSGWGGAADGPSYAGWAVCPSHEGEVFRRIDNRTEMKRTRVVLANYRPKTRGGHCHIYVERDCLENGCFPKEEVTK